MGRDEESDRLWAEFRASRYDPDKLAEIERISGLIPPTDDVECKIIGGLRFSNRPIKPNLIPGNLGPGKIRVYAGSIPPTDDEDPIYEVECKDSDIENDTIRIANLPSGFILTNEAAKKIMRRYAETGITLTQDEVIRLCAG